MTENTQAAATANDKVTQATEDVAMPMGNMDDETKSLHREILVIGLVCSTFFGLFGLIGLCFIEDKRKKRPYLKGCIIGNAIALIVLVILVIVLPLTT